MTRKLPQHNIRHLYGADKSNKQKAQVNAPTIPSTQSVAQSTTPKIAKIPIKSEKKKESKIPPSGIVQQPPKGIVIPLGALIPPIVMPPSVRPPSKPPNVDNATTIPSLGPEPNMDIEENSPHQEGIITETYVVPDQSYLEQLQELIKLVSTQKVVQQYLP